MSVGARGIKRGHGLEDDIDKLEIDLLIIRHGRRRRGVGHGVRREDELHAITHAIVEMQARAKTADERIMPKGTAAITDVGMTGPANSVIGMDPQGSILKFKTLMPTRFEVANGPAMLCGVVIDIDPTTGQANEITRLQVMHS